MQMIAKSLVSKINSITGVPSNLVCYRYYVELAVLPSHCIELPNCLPHLRLSFTANHVSSSWFILNCVNILDTTLRGPDEIFQQNHRYGLFPKDYFHLCHKFLVKVVVVR